MCNAHTYSKRKNQRGMALAFGLILLLITTIIVIAAVRATTTQGRMAANSQFQTVTFQAAEGAIHGVMGEIRGDIAAPVGAANILVDAIGTPAGGTPRTAHSR